MRLVRSWWPVIGLLLAPILPLWRVFFYGEGIGPFDQVRQLIPWYSYAPNKPWDVLQADGVLQFFPWRDLVFDSWSKGQLPFWNPYELAGTPLLANSQSAAFYPPHILLGFVRLPTSLSMALLAWFHLFWAGLGIYQLVRCIGGNRVGGVVAGISFSLSAFMLAWTPLPSVISTVAWIPWILSYALQLSEGSYDLKTAAKLSVCTGMMLLAGHLQFAAYGLIAGLLLLITMAVTKRQWKAAFLPLLPVAIGILMAAPQLLPVLAYTQFSHRRAAATEQGYEAYVSGSISPFQLSGAVFPSTMGHPTEPTSLETPELKNANSYWPMLVKPGANYAEAAIAVGPLALFFLAFVSRSRWRQPRTVALIVVGSFALLLAMGTPLNRLLYFALPGWSASGSPGRIAVLVVLVLCALAGLGASNLVGSNERPKPTLPLILLLFIGLGTAILPMTPLGKPSGTSLDDKILSAAVASAFLNAFPWVLAALVASVAAITLKMRSSEQRTGVLLAASLIVAVCLYNGHTPISTGAAFPSRIDTPMTMDRVAVANDHWNLFTTPTQAFAPPNTPSIVRLHELGGYDSLVHRDTVALLQDIDGQNPSPPENGNMMFLKPTADLKKLADAGVTQLWSYVKIDALGEGTITQNYHVYDIPGPGRAYTPEGEAAIVEDGYDRQTVVAQGPGTLTIKDRNMPGWTADVDGQPAEVKGELWREVDLPSGEHQISFRYRPPGLTLGLVLGFFGWLWCCLTLLAAGRIPVRNPAPSEAEGPIAA